MNTLAEFDVQLHPAEKQGAVIVTVTNKAENTCGFQLVDIEHSCRKVVKDYLKEFPEDKTKLFL